MICPGCTRETSDMMSRCEWCGSPLFASAPAEPPAGGPPPPEPAPGEWYPYQGGAPAPPPPEPPVKERRPFYERPWLYVAAILIVLIVVGLFLAFDRGASGHPELVSGSKPTLLDFYNDT